MARFACRWPGLAACVYGLHIEVYFQDTRLMILIKAREKSAVKCLSGQVYPKSPYSTSVSD